MLVGRKKKKAGSSEKPGVYKICNQLYLANKTFAGLLLHPAGFCIRILNTLDTLLPSSLPSQRAFRVFFCGKRDMRAAKKLYANLISKLFEA